VGTAGRYTSKRTRHVRIVQTDLTAPEEVGLAHTWREGSMPRTRSRSTEVDAYIFIKDTLKELGWDTRNPHRNSMGAVYTQNECLEDPTIKAALDKDRPENIVKISTSQYWVIEAKREQKWLSSAISEAEEYARRIHAQDGVSVPLISGVAGNEASGYLMETRLLVGQTYRRWRSTGSPRLPCFLLTPFVG
jgi:hypothetical protein